MPAAVPAFDSHERPSAVAPAAPQVKDARSRIAAERQPGHGVDDRAGGDDRQESARPRFLISDLCAYLDTYLPPEQVSEVYRAYLFGAEAHHGQQRQTGEPYI